MTLGEQDVREATDGTEQGISGMAVGSLVLSIVAIILTVTVQQQYAPFAFAAGAAGLVLGIVGGRVAATQQLSGVWFARVGILISAVAILVGAFWFNR